MRAISVDDWMTDQSSHSYAIALSDMSRTQLLADLRAIVHDRFPDGAMTVPYESWLWIATRR